MNRRSFLIVLGVVLVTGSAAAADRNPYPVVRDPLPVKKTLCGCAETLECTCWESTCGCVRCGRGGAAVQAGKLPSLTGATGAYTLAQSAGGKGAKQESSADTTPAVTSTNATLIRLPSNGGTSGCANGQCQTQTTRRFRR